MAEIWWVPGTRVTVNTGLCSSWPGSGTPSSYHTILPALVVADSVTGVFATVMSFSATCMIGAAASRRMTNNWFSRLPPGTIADTPLGSAAG